MMVSVWPAAAVWPLMAMAVGPALNESVCDPYVRVPVPGEMGNAEGMG